MNAVLTTPKYQSPTQFMRKRLRPELDKLVYEGKMTPAKADVLMLWSLQHSSPGDAHWLDSKINERAALAAKLARHAHEGKVLVIESGRDCDCVEYSGRRHVIDATPKAYHKLYDETYEWADGPFTFTVVPWDTQVEYESRDLVMEAHENGHPHHVVSRFA